MENRKLDNFVPPKGAKIAVAMSGGVDSSVTCALLKEAGYEVAGFFMNMGIPSSVTKNSKSCCSAVDARDAARVASKFEVPYYSLDFSEGGKTLIDYFVAEYDRGRTPNPCVMCNQKVKFSKLLNFIDELGFDYLATGHYARVVNHRGAKHIARGVCAEKDQSYFLFGVDSGLIERIVFPLGTMTKDEVRDEARRFGLGVAEKAESQEICFVPDDDYRTLLKDRIPERIRPGKVIGPEGDEVGEHDGFQMYTVGQRKGLRIAVGKPVYVKNIDRESNTVSLGERDDLMAKEFIARDAKFTNMPLAEHEWAKGGRVSMFDAAVQIRYHHEAQPASVEIFSGGTFLVRFHEPVWAITPGQAAVVYDEDVVLGGGFIDRVY
ncbi:MAG: tRNA 2-thiouridine(34) synthase MnmA [Planctomycetes bacterium]|nr:tRNA 2-thiouridine(34) synthase MnmA [Planctomycetota bacterium]